MTLNLYPKFGYINARTKGMKAKLLSEDKLNQLLAVKSLDEVIAILEETQYKEKMVEFSTRYSGIELVNRAVNADFVSAIRKIAKFLPQNEKTGELYALALQEWLMEDYKILIASKATGATVDPSQFTFLAQEQPTLFDAVKSSDVDLEKTVKKLAAYGGIQNQVFRQIASTYFRGKKLEDYRQLFKELDDYYYNKLGKLASTQSDTAISQLLKAKIDFLNLMMALRLKLSGADNKEIEKNAVGGKKGERTVRKLLNSEKIEEMVEEVVKIYKLGPQIAGEFNKSHSLVQLEIALERRLMERAMRTAAVSALSFAVVLGYIYLKRQETIVLKSIAYSTIEGVRDEMKKILIPARYSKKQQFSY